MINSKLKNVIFIILLCCFCFILQSCKKGYEIKNVRWFCEDDLIMDFIFVDSEPYYGKGYLEYDNVKRNAVLQYGRSNMFSIRLIENNKILDSDEACFISGNYKIKKDCLELKIKKDSIFNSYSDTKLELKKENINLDDIDIRYYSNACFVDAENDVFFEIKQGTWNYGYGQIDNNTDIYFEFISDTNFIIYAIENDEIISEKYIKGQYYSVHRGANLIVDENNINDITEYYISLK